MDENSTMEAVTAKKKILFVDDEPNILQGFRRLLRNHRTRWDMEFVASGQEALEKLATDDFDIIVTDLCMPTMSGVNLLDQVKTLYPNMIRFILSGHADSDMIMQSVGVAHQFLAKPCDAELFQEAITRAVHLQKLLHPKQVQSIIQDGASLPTLPELYQELTAVLQSRNSNAEKISAVISKDVSITAKVLQLVNSAFFGLTRRVDSIPQAVGLLGAGTISNIVMISQVFGEFDPGKVEEFGIRDIYAHSLTVGSYAARLVKAVGHSRKSIDEAMLAGMVHELGKLVLINSNNETWLELYRNRKQLTQPFCEAEREALGTTYAEVGAYLIGLWGLSNYVVEAVADHIRPATALSSGSFGSLAALHLANGFYSHQNPDFEGKSPLDMDYLESLGIVDRIDEFQQLCAVGADEK
ncbi:response regulator [Pontiella agarivorans]|uniref:Response regulator n=1 Tax=Pontiella agarivorans TaxID=3038953 RepID=A0ABU5MSU9_9BACT|nr:response regulator [Pontiella agarivorans]MDZ8117274.1 response regulator [Pontiella agarivorans]